MRSEFKQTISVCFIFAVKKSKILIFKYVSHVLIWSNFYKRKC